MLTYIYSLLLLEMQNTSEVHIAYALLNSVMYDITISAAVLYAHVMPSLIFLLTKPLQKITSFLGNSFILTLFFPQTPFYFIFEFLFSFVADNQLLVFCRYCTSLACFFRVSFFPYAAED